MDDITRFRNLVAEMQRKHPKANVETLLDLIIDEVGNDDAMRRAVVKDCLHGVLVN